MQSALNFPGVCLEEVGVQEEDLQEVCGCGSGGVCCCRASCTQVVQVPGLDRIQSILRLTYASWPAYK